MKTKRLFVLMLALILMVVSTAACGTSSASEDNSSPAATEINEPTATPEPLPDLSTARISLEDLPEGFKEIDMQDAGQTQSEAGEEENLPDVYFTFVNEDNFQIVTGMNFLLTNPVDRIGYGAAFRDSDDTLRDLAGAMGGTNIREVESLSGLEELGDKQEAVTMISDVEGVPMRVDAVMFQRGDVGSILLTMSVEGAPGSISLEELGAALDQNIQESLATD